MGVGWITYHPDLNRTFSSRLSSLGWNRGRGGGGSLHVRVTGTLELPGCGMFITPDTCTNNQFCILCVVIAIVTLRAHVRGKVISRVRLSVFITKKC